ncbi:hypothetical protein CCACVL1_00601, partial [Corchorus capsularis]
QLDPHLLMFFDDIALRRRNYEHKEKRSRSLVEE